MNDNMSFIQMSSTDIKCQSVSRKEIDKSIQFK